MIGTIDRASKQVKDKERRHEQLEMEQKKIKNQKKKNKMRGRDDPQAGV